MLKRFCRPVSCRLARNAALVVLFTCLLAGPALGQTGNVVVSVNNISIAGETSLRGLTGAFPYPVLSTISVTDQAGNVVTGLADTARFIGPAEIAEIGAPVSQIWQPLLEYHRDNPAFPANQNLFNQTPQPSFTEVRRTTYFPTSTMLVMDISGSMKPQLEEAKASNLAYLEQLRSYDRAGLIQFCASVVNTLPISSDLSTLRQEIVAADTCTGTAIENALLAALEVIRHETTRRGIIIYTDGQNFPFTEPTPGPVIAMAQEFNIPIFTIALGDQTREDILELIAEQTGGLFFSAETAADMVEIYEKIAVVIQNFYVMAHASPDPIRNDTWRVVDVTGGTLSNRDRGLGHYFVANQSSSRVTDLALSLTANTETARPGDTFEYLLHLSNSGPSEGRGLDLKQHLPDSVRFLSAIPAPVFGRGDSLFWQIPALAAGNTFDIRVSVQLSPQTPSTLTELISHARLSAANDSSPDNNLASDTVRVIFTPPPNNTELAFSISSQTQVPGEARTGEAYSYHIQFNNLGAHAAQNIRVAQLLPDSVRFLSSIPASSINGDSLIWQIAAIGAGMQDSIIVNVQLAANVPPTLTELISFANFTADNDTTLANNFDTDTLRVISPPPLGIVDLEFSLTSQTQVPGAVQTGEVFSYKIKFNNPYPKSAENIRVAQFLPDSVRFLSSIPASSINGDSLIWQIAAIDAGSQDSITVNVQLATNVPPTLTQLISFANFTADNDTTLANNFDSDTLRVISQPPPPGITDLAFSLNSQTQVAGEARTGEAFSYNLRLSNIGANAAQNVRVAQILPDSVRFLSSSRISSISGDSLIWQIAAIAASSQDSITVNVQLATNVPPTLTQLISFANFTADNDTTLANNFDSDTLRVISQPPPPGITDLAFSLNSQTQVAGEARTGEAFSYNLRLSNIGANAAQNIRIAQILPDSVRFLSASRISSISGDSLIWQIAAIAAGAQDSIIVNVQLAANVPPTLTELISFANFTADNDTTPANNFDADTLRVISQPPPPGITDLTFSLNSQTHVAGEARTSEAFSYQIRLNNPGANDAQNVRVAQLLPDSVRFLSSIPISSINGDSLIWQIAAIDAGAQDSIIVNVQLAANVPATLTELISFANFTADNDTTPASNFDSDTLRVISQPPPPGITDLAFSLNSQTQVPGEARTGEAFSYHIKLNNIGPNAAQNIRIAQILPDSVRFLSASRISSISGDSLIWQIAAIAAGGQDSITVNVQLAANVPPTLTQLISFANFTADNDTTLANNFDTDTLQVISQPPPPGITDLAFSLNSQTQVAGEARAGEVFSYHIKLNNTGANAAQNVRIAQILPDSVRFLSSSRISSISGDSLIWQIAAIASGSQDSITVNVQLAANVPPTLTELISFANFTADNDTTLANNFDSDTLRVISQPPPLGITDLAFSLMSQTQVPGEARTGEAFSYQIKLNNIGANPAQNVRIAQILPDSVRFLSSSRISTISGDSLIWQIAAIDAGAQDSITVNVQLATNVPPTLTQLISFANFTADNDTTLANNFDTDTLRVISQPPPPGITDLAFSLNSQTQVPGEARTGEAFSYHIKLNNTGANAAQNIRIAQILPDSVRFLSSSRASSVSGDSLIWHIAAIAAGAQDSIIVNVQLAANAPPTLTELISFANFNADNDTTLANNFDSDTLRVISQPPLGVTDLAFSLNSQTQVPGEARTGEAFSYQIKLNNIGPNAAQNIRVAQILPDSVRFLSSSQTSSISGDSLIWQIAAIVAGAQDSIIVNVQLAANVPPTLTELISFANFTADNDTTLANNFDSDTLRVISQPPPPGITDLAFSLNSQTPVAGEARTGEAFSYQIKLNNVGSNAAQNVRIAQILPDSVRFLSSIPTSSISGDSLIWQIAAIAAGGQDSITVNVQLAANVPPTLTQLISFANFTADNDTTLANNFDTDTLRVISQPPPPGITDLAFSLNSQTQVAGEARTGEAFSYQIKLNNIGANPAQNIRVAQILPDSVRFLSSSQTSSVSGDSLIWQIAAIDAGAQDSIIVNVQLAANVPPTLTELISFANFTADNDTTLANNFDTDTLRVISQPPPPGITDLAFSLNSQTQVAGEARTGEAFSYQIKLNNIGPNAAQNIRIAQILPDSVRFLSSSRISSISGDSLIWQIAAIDAGAQDSIIVNVQLAANVPPALTQLISFANFTADNDTTLANNFDSDTLRVISQPPPPGITDLAFSLNSQTQVPGEARTGEAFSYQLKLNNIGANAAQNIRVAQILPDSVRFLSSSRISSISGDSLIWQIAAIAAGAQDSIIVNVQLAANVPATLTELISFANFTADNDTTLANNSDSDTLRVISQPPPPGITDLAFSLNSQTQVPGEARTGEAFSYQIKLNNVGVNAAQNIRVAQILPDSVRFLSASRISSISGDSLIWQIAAIDAGAQDSIIVNVQLAANVPPTLTQLISFANFTADNDTTLANNFDTDTLRVISQPPLAATDLAFSLNSQTQVAGEARTGEAFLYQIKLNNIGSNAAQNGRIAQILPDSVRFLSSSRISSISGDSLIWQIAAIAAGAQDSIIVNVQLVANVPPTLTQLISFANFTADNDTTLANNFDTDTLRVISQPPLAATDLAFSLNSQTQVAGEARTGEAFLYQIKLNNIGSNAAQNVRIAQILPDSVRFLSSSQTSSVSGDSLIWQIAAIAAGAQDSIIVNVQLAANVPPTLTQLISFANFTADNDTTLANNFDTDTLRVISQPPPPGITDLAFSLNSQTQVPGEARTGEAFSYQIKLNNIGANAAQNIRVAQILPDSVRFLSSSQTSSISGDSLIWQIAAIAAGGQDSITVNVQLATNVPPTLTQLISFANFTADNDTTLANNFDTDTLRVISQPPLAATDLAFSLTSQTQVAGEARTGEAFSYQIKLNNVGVNAAQNIRVAQILPDSVRFLSSSRASSASGDSLIWQIAAIPGGAQDSIIVNVQLAANVPPTLTELITFANFTADNDTTPANNFDTDTLRVISQPPLAATDLVFSLTSQTQAPGEARTGEAFSYQIKLNNVGANAAQDVRVAQILPDSVRFLSSSRISSTSGDSLIWQIAAIPAGAQDSITVNVQLAANVPPTLTELISFANFTADNDTTLANNFDTDTLRVISQPPPPIVPPQITATPPMVQVGDSVFIRVQVEQAIQKWDLWVYFVTGAIDSSFADGFIAGTPLTPQIWYDVHPAFSETKLLTQAQQERIEFELRTIDLFGRPASTRASVTVRAGNALVLDRNVYEAERQGPLAIKFRLSSNRVARLDLLDLNGQKVTEIIQAPFSAGWNTHFWNGFTQDGRRVGSGVYVVTLHSQDFNDWKKVIVVR